MRLIAAASSVLQPVLAGPAQPATWLGVTPAALYLRTPSAPDVIALLAHDAVRLPCALVLPTTAAELPLTRLATTVGEAMVGAGCLAWTGPTGRVVVRAVREWAPARVSAPQPRCWRPAVALAAAFDALPAPATFAIDAALLTLLATEPASAVAALLGRGPGLTPAGDDVVAGFLLGARAVELDAADALTAVAAMARARTTTLSAALLLHAARGECIDQVADVVADPSKRSVGALLRVGHTSGAALATGLLTAALAALDAGRAGAAA